MNLSENYRIIEGDNVSFVFSNELFMQSYIIPLTNISTSFNFSNKANRIEYAPLIDDKDSKIIIVGLKDDCAQAKVVNFKVLHPPKIINRSPIREEVVVQFGDKEGFEVRIIDNDDLLHTYTWKMDEKNLSKAIKLIFSPDNETPGRHNLTLIVKDDDNLTSSTTWELVITPKNNAPFMFSEFPEYAWVNDRALTTQSLDNYFSDTESEQLSYNIRFFNENGEEVNIGYELGENNEIILTNANNHTGLLYMEVTAKDELGLIAKSNKIGLAVIPGQNMLDVKKIVVHVCGDQVCGGNETCQTCERDCGPCKEGQTKCEKDWICSPWSRCYINGVMIRECKDLNGCYDISDRPESFSFCTPFASCTDKIKNQNEDKIDCGGVCGPCPNCYDRKQNQGEKGIDCEGPCNDKCPSCFDGLQNGKESDIDCGGGCRLCLEEEKCYIYSDCTSRSCRGGICQRPTCYDAVVNQDEEGLDCGGICKIPCPTCFDNSKNQDEEDVDCGGSCEAICPSCNDNIKNNGEWLIDCGGPCKLCKAITFPASITFGIITLLLLIFLTPRLIHELNDRGYFDNFNSKFFLLVLANIKPREEKNIIDREGKTQEVVHELEKIQKELFISSKKFKQRFIEKMYEYYILVFGLNLDSDKAEIKLKISERLGYPYDTILFTLYKEIKAADKNSELSFLELNSLCKKTIKTMKLIAKKTSKQKS